MATSPGKGFVVQTSGNKTRYYNPSTGAHTAWSSSSSSSSGSSSGNSSSSSKKGTISNWDSLSESAKKALAEQGYGPSKSSSSGEVNYEIQEKDGKYRIYYPDTGGTTAWRTEEEWKQAEIDEAKEIELRKKMAEESPEDYYLTYVGKEGLSKQVPEGAEKVTIDVKKGEVSYITKEKAKEYKEAILYQDVPQLTDNKSVKVSETFAKETDKGFVTVKTAKEGMSLADSSKLMVTEIKKPEPFFTMEAYPFTGGMAVPIPRPVKKAISKAKDFFQTKTEEISSGAEERFFGGIKALSTAAVGSSGGIFEYSKGSPEEIAEKSQQRVESQILKDWDKRREELLGLQKEDASLEEYERVASKWDIAVSNNVERTLKNVDKDIYWAEKEKVTRSTAGSIISGIASIPTGTAAMLFTPTAEIYSSFIDMGQSIYSQPELSVGIIGSLAGQALAMGAVSYGVSYAAPRIKGFISKTTGKQRLRSDVSYIEGSEKLDVGIKKEVNPLTGKNEQLQVVRSVQSPKIRAYAKQGDYFVELVVDQGDLVYVSKVNIKTLTGKQISKGILKGKAKVYRTPKVKPSADITFDLISDTDVFVDIAGKTQVSGTAALGKVKTQVSYLKGNKIAKKLVSEDYYTPFSADVTKSGWLEVGKTAASKRTGIYQEMAYKAVTSKSDTPILKLFDNDLSVSAVKKGIALTDDISLDLSAGAGSQRYVIKIPKNEFTIQSGKVTQVGQLRNVKPYYDMYGTKYTQVGRTNIQGASAGITVKGTVPSEYFDITPETILGYKKATVNIKSSTKTPLYKTMKPASRSTKKYWDTSFLKTDTLTEKTINIPDTRGISTKTIPSSNIEAAARDLLKSVMPKTTYPSAKAVIKPIAFTSTYAPTIFSEKKLINTGVAPSKVTEKYLVPLSGDKFKDYKSESFVKEISKTSSLVGTSDLLKTDDRRKFRGDERLDEDIITIDDTKIAEDNIQRELLDPVVFTGTDVFSATSVKSASLTKTRTSTKSKTESQLMRDFVNVPMPNIMPIPTITTPFIAAIPNFRTGMGASFKKTRQKKPKAKSAYVPSLVARELKTTTTKQPKFLTGIERRPLLRTKKTKRRRQLSFNMPSINFKI